MSIYGAEKRIDYRKIYESYYGPIPVDNEGRTFDVHHKDGDKHNNDPKNLLALSKKDHYELHLKQGDNGATLLLSKDMKISPKEKSELARKSALERLEKGNHPFLDSEFQRKHQLERLENGTHHFLDEEWQKLNNPYLQPNFQKNVQSERINSGTHHFLDEEWQKLNNPWKNGLKQREKVLQLVEKGNHPWQNKKRVECSHCGKVMDSSNYVRWHGDNCKHKLKKEIINV